MPSVTILSYSNTLERHYASPIDTRVLQLCGELLHAARADYVSTAAYLNKIKSIADNLRLAGGPIADHDLVIIVMNAFPTYEFSTTAITFDYLQKVLLNLEKHLTQPGVPVYSLEPATALIHASPYRGSGVDPGGFSHTVGPSSTTNAIMLMVTVPHLPIVLLVLLRLVVIVVFLAHRKC
ncbi:hypothetical protein CerSpe_288210 [Prunus speciosa]